MTNIIVPAILAAVVVAGVVHTRVKRGRRFMRSRRSTPRLVLNVVLLAVAVFGLVASARSAKGPWDSISSLSIVLFALSDMGFDLYGRPQTGQFAFYENGLLTHDGRRLVFSKWGEFERYEWQGDTPGIPSHRRGTGPRRADQRHRCPARAPRRRPGRRRAPPARLSRGRPHRLESSALAA